MNLRILTLAVVMMLLSLMSSNGYTQEMTPETWVQIDSDVKVLTVEGMERRHTLLLRRAGIEEQAIDDADTQAQIGKVYLAHNTTAVEHLIYWQHNKKGISEWLSDHPAIQAQRAEVQQQFDQLLEQFAQLQSPSNSGAN